MNKKFMVFVCVALTAMLAMCVCAGCKKKSDGAADQVEVTISYVAGTDQLAPTVSTTVKVAADATVYDALLATGYEIDAEDTQYGKYVHGINGVMDSANTGWVYTENDNEVMEGADAHKVVPGAVYLWTLISW